MTLLRRLLLIIAVALIGAAPSYGLIEVTTAYICPGGSAVDVAWTTLIYNATGRLVSGNGVCCDGSVWAKNFDFVTPGGDSQIDNLQATISWSSSGMLTVTANMELDMQIVNIQTGQYVTDLYHYTQINMPFAISVAQLPLGLYGVALSHNGSPVHLLPFSLQGQ